VKGGGEEKGQDEKVSRSKLLTDKEEEGEGK